MSNKLLFKYIYDVESPSLLVHAINDPASESDSMLCGVGKEIIPGKDRRYASYADGIPEGREICPDCMSILKRRIGNIYGIPEWENSGKE